MRSPWMASCSRACPSASGAPPTTRLPSRSRSARASQTPTSTSRPWASGRTSRQLPPPCRLALRRRRCVPRRDVPRCSAARSLPSSPFCPPDASRRSADPTLRLRFLSAFRRAAPGASGRGAPHLRRRAAVLPHGGADSRASRVFWRDQVVRPHSRSRDAAVEGVRSKRRRRGRVSRPGAQRVEPGPRAAAAATEGGSGHLGSRHRGSIGMPTRLPPLSGDARGFCASAATIEGASIPGHLPSPPRVNRHLRMFRRRRDAGRTGRPRSAAHPSFPLPGAGTVLWCTKTRRSRTLPARACMACAWATGT